MDFSILQIAISQIRFHSLLPIATKVWFVFVKDTSLAATQTETRGSSRAFDMAVFEKENYVSKK
jgi:hypothetical protein